MLMPAWPRWMPPPHSQFMVHTYGVRMGARLLGASRAGQHVLTQPSSSRLGRQGRGLMLLLLLGGGGGSGLRSCGDSNCGQRKQGRRVARRSAVRWLAAACHDFTRQKDQGDQRRTEGGGRGPGEDRERAHAWAWHGQSPYLGRRRGRGRGQAGHRHAAQRVAVFCSRSILDSCSRQ